MCLTFGKHYHCKSRFFLNFLNLGITANLQKSCKHSTKIACPSSMLYNITTLLNHGTFVKAKKINNLRTFSSVQSCPTLCDPMNCSMPGLPVHHQLPESTQTHVHRVGDTIQPSHPLSSPSPPAFNLSQHQGLLFQWASSSDVKSHLMGGQSTGVSASASVLPKNTQDWPLLAWTDWISLKSKGLSRVFSNTTVQKHQFFGAKLSS